MKTNKALSKYWLVYLLTANNFQIREWGSIYIGYELSLLKEPVAYNF